MNNKMKKDSGITLIALIVTIVVLLIIASIAINNAIGNNGIMIKLQQAIMKKEIAEVIEKAKIDVVNYKTEKLINGEEIILGKLKIKNIIENANQNSNNKYYKELTEDGIITKNGYLVGYDEIEKELSENNESNNGNNNETREIMLGSLGVVEVKAPLNTTFTYDESTGDVKAIPPEKDMPENPDDMEGIENIEEPTLINFTIGNIEQDIQEEYQTVEYNEIATVIKFPVDYQCWDLSKWRYTEESATALNVTLTDIEEKYSTYIVCQNELIYAGMEFMGVESSSLEFYVIENDEDDTEENAIYLAAFIAQAKQKTFYIAKWDGEKYVKQNLDANILAIDNFFEVVSIPRTKQVRVQSVGDKTYVPIDSLTAEEGMTWNEWLESDYNTTDLTLSSKITDKQENIIDKTSTISNNGEYVVGDQINFGVYWYGTKTTYVADVGMTWEEWINSEYNVDGYVIKSNFVYKAENSRWYVNPTGYNTPYFGEQVNITDVINPNIEYFFDDNPPQHDKVPVTDVP